jgi:hypothetical protein
MSAVHAFRSSTYDDYRYEGSGKRAKMDNQIEDSDENIKDEAAADAGSDGSVSRSETGNVKVKDEHKDDESEDGRNEDKDTVNPKLFETAAEYIDGAKSDASE